MIIDYNILKGPPDPREISGIITDNSGEHVGEWKAFICEDENALWKYIHLRKPDLEKVCVHTKHQWPLAYLSHIIVYERFSNMGHGSNGLRQFQQVASTKKCRFALARIGWEDEDMEKNIHFYQRNGWTNLFSINSDGMPFELPLTLTEINHI
jgi:hypothetical protein